VNSHPTTLLVEALDNGATSCLLLRSDSAERPVLEARTAPANSQEVYLMAISLVRHSASNFPVRPHNLPPRYDLTGRGCYGAALRESTVQAAEGGAA
jgi:hypothetical protein